MEACGKSGGFIMQFMPEGRRVADLSAFLKIAYFCVDFTANYKDDQGKGDM